MSDDELLWEPVDGCWSVRKRDGKWTFEVVKPDPDPAPFTTIAWLIAHMTQVAFVVGHAVRGEPVRGRPATFGTATDAVVEWSACVDALATALDEATDEDLARDYASSPGAEPNSVEAMVWRTIYELIHHGAEVSRMRHLYANRLTLHA
ncbi:MAG: hypothetical protein V7636_54 [Actinomycetota bacterium]